MLQEKLWTQEEKWKKSEGEEDGRRKVKKKKIEESRCDRPKVWLFPHPVSSVRWNGHCCETWLLIDWITYKEDLVKKLKEWKKNVIQKCLFFSFHSLECWTVSRTVWNFLLVTVDELNIHWMNVILALFSSIQTKLYVYKCYEKVIPHFLIWYAMCKLIQFFQMF